MESIKITASTNAKLLKEIICNALDENGFQLIIDTSDYLAFMKKDDFQSSFNHTIEDRLNHIEDRLNEHISQIH